LIFLHPKARSAKDGFVAMARDQLWKSFEEIDQNFDLSDTFRWNALIRSNLIPDLKIEYENTRNILSLSPRHRLTFLRTGEEMLFANLLKAEGVKLEYAPSLLIGPFVLDFYFPALKIAFEIDGQIHDQEPKSRVDMKKLELLGRFGIALSSIENFDLINRNPTVMAIIRKLASVPRLDSRARQRLLKLIFIATILYWRGESPLIRLRGGS
jgi:very-short-patch-repair endonuclease